MAGPDSANPIESIAKKPGEDGFLVVGIGASAGGVEALSQFFANAPDDAHISYVVILHLSPDHDSHLAHVLQQVTKMHVEQVTKQTKIKPDHVYVIPPDKSLSMKDGSIVVRSIKTVEERRAPVDIFFRTLAESHGHNAVGVILSGTGANGSMGIKRIKEFGGATFVQNPREAEFNEMPRNSIATELIDMILPVAEIPQYIVRYRDRVGSVHIPEEPADRGEDQQSALRDIFTQLRVRTGHDFSNYKRPTMLRRIERRISVRNLPDLAAYAEYLREHPDEANALLKDLLISVTNFFRDKKAFEALEKNIFPRLIESASPLKPVRVWVAGCATGEEAYSIAMIASELTAGSIDGPQVQIFATDIDERAIAAARGGLYTLNDAADVSPERMRRFFTKEGDHYRVRREVREMVLFAQHNVIKDPPFSHVDLITCRNLLIYLNHTAQERVFETIHFALEPGGYLMLGSSESVDGSADLFMTVDKENHIFQSRHVAARPLPVLESVPFYRSTLPSVAAGPKRGEPERITYNELHLRLVEEFALPSVVVNEDYDLVHVSPRAGKYMMMPGGEPSNNLLRLINPEIRLELRTALFQATQQKRNVEVRNLKVSLDHHEETLNLLVRPVTGEDDPARGFVLVVFEPSTRPDGSGGRGITREADQSASQPVAQQLEEELIRSRTQLQSALEQSEVQSEELRASNEELQAMNEELRSSAEELETSKEELQSINEELTTLNQELKVKIEELSHSNNNFANLLSSIDIAVIFLDRSLRINLFSPAAGRIFNVISSDVGRPLSDITNSFDHDVTADADLVLESLQALEREVSSFDGRIFELRVFPYRTEDDRINGVVLTFADITLRKRSEMALAKSEEQFRRAIEEAPIPVIMHAEDGEVLQISRTWTALTGYTIEDVPTLDAWLSRAYGEGADEVRSHMQQLFKGDRSSIDIEFLVRTRAGETRHWSFNASSPGTLRDGRRFIVGMAVDITDRKKVEAELRESEEKYRTLFGSMDEGFCIIEMIYDDKRRPVDWRFLQVNAAFERNNGLTNAEGKTIRELVPDIEPKWVKIYDEVARTGEPRRFEEDSAVLGRAFTLYAFRIGEPDARRIAVIFSDISERRRAEQELRELYEKYYLIVESIADAFYTVDSNWNFTYINNKAEQIWGKTREDLLGRHLWEVFPEAVGSHSSDQLHKALDERIPITFTTMSPVLGHWVEVSAYPMSQGGLTVYFRDISDRMRAEEELNFLSYLLNAVEQSVIATDLDGRVIFWNSHAEKMFGWTADEAIGRPVLELNVPDFESHKGEQIMESLIRGEPWSGEFTLMRRDGSTFAADVYDSPLKNEAGDLVGIVGVSIDLTQRKQTEAALHASEERIRLMMDSFVDIALFTTDTKSIVTAWNPGAEKVFGFTAREMIGKQSADIVFTPEDREKGEPDKERRTALKYGKALDERWHIRKDGERFFASGFMVAISDGEKHIGYGKIAQDLSDRKRAEQAIRDREVLKRLVATQEDERRRIARDLHDHLGQQLTALRLKIEGLKANYQAEPAMMKAIDETQSQAKQIDDDVSFMTWELRPTALDNLGLRNALGNFVNEWSKNYGIPAEFHSARIRRLRLTPDTEINIYRIAQEALNNVVKHANAKKVDVMLEFGKSDLVLMVEDDGRGFDRRASSRSKVKRGLGLIGMKERATMLGGTLEIETGRSKGTTIIVRVPVTETGKKNAAPARGSSGQRSRSKRPNPDT